MASCGSYRPRQNYRSVGRFFLSLLSATLSCFQLRYHESMLTISILLQPGDCSVFGACVAEESTWDPAAPLSGQLVYDGVLPMVHILTKDEEKRRRKEDEKKRRMEQKSADAKEAKVQQLKQKHALKKQKRLSRGESTMSSRGSAGIEDTRSSEDGELESSATSTHSTHSHKSHPADASSEKHEKSKDESDTKGPTRKDSDEKLQRSNSPVDDESGTPNSSTKAGRRRSSKRQSSERPRSVRLTSSEKSSGKLEQFSVSSSAPSAASPISGAVADADAEESVGTPRDNDSAPNSRRLGALPTVLSNMVKHYDDDRITDSSASSLPGTPRDSAATTTTEAKDSSEMESPRLSFSRGRQSIESPPGSTTLSQESNTSTPRATHNQHAQLILNWTVGAHESEYEERCNLLCIAWNELHEHSVAHPALLIEVQELGSPRGLEDVEIEEEVESTSKDEHHHHHLHMHRHHRKHSSELEEEEKVTHVSTAKPTAERGGVHSDPKYKPAPRVQRGMSAAYLRSAATLKKADVERLENATYFDQDEIRELHVLFSKVSGYTLHITAETFNAFLPELSDPELRRAVFTAFDKSHEFDDKISFDEFVQSLSSMCRGTPEERARVVFDMCATASRFGPAHITRDSVLRIVGRIATAMEHAGFEPRDYGSPAQVVNNVFLKQSAQAVESSTKSSVRGRIAVFAKGIGHLRRDERHSAKAYAKADLHERNELGEDEEYDQVGDSEDSEDSADSETDSTDGSGSSTNPTDDETRPRKHKRGLSGSKDNITRNHAKDRPSFFQRVASRRMESQQRKQSFRVPKTDSSAVPPRPLFDSASNPFSMSYSLNQSQVLSEAQALNSSQLVDHTQTALSQTQQLLNIDPDHALGGSAMEEERKAQLAKVAELEKDLEKLELEKLELEKSDASGDEDLGHDADSESFENMMADSSSAGEPIPEVKIEPLIEEKVVTKEVKVRRKPVEGEDHAGEEDEDDAAAAASSSGTSPKPSPRALKPKPIIEEETAALASEDSEAKKQRVAFAFSNDRIEVPDHEMDEEEVKKARSPALPRRMRPGDTHAPPSDEISHSHTTSGTSTPPSPDSPVPVRRAGHNRIQTNHYETGLTRKQFKTRCKNEPDLAECFGLFDFFNSAVVEPLIRLGAERSHMKLVSIAGVMTKERGSMSRKIGKWGDKRYFVLKDGFLGYSKRPAGPLERAIPLFGASIKPNITEKKFALTIIAPFFHRKLSLPTAEQAQMWLHALRQMLSGGKLRFKSFAPPREGISVRPFMNGKEYFDALVPILARVKRRLLIGGWYLSPGLLLKRGAVDAAMDRFRLDNMILDAANRGVSVYILIYNAPSFTDFDLQPTYVCNFFNNLHPNIHAMMHPNNRIPSMWSHHQKLVSCDETVAFIGGIDLCYGRYEDSDYNITDELETNFPGRDYCNVFLENESNGPSEQSVVDRAKQPRMPWCDVQVQMNGMAAYDVALNFMQRWDHIVRQGTYECKSMPYVFPSHSVRDPSQAEGVIDAATGQPFPSEVDGVQSLSTLTGTAIERLSDSSTSTKSKEKEKEREKDREKENQKVLENETSSEKLSKSAVQREDEKEAHRTKKKRERVAKEARDDASKGKDDTSSKGKDNTSSKGKDRASSSSPDSPEVSDVESEDLEDIRPKANPLNPTAAEPLVVEEMTASNSVLIVPEVSWDSRVPMENVALPEEELGYADCNVQIVRSVCSWSGGTAAPEQSIYKAYIDLIRNAEHSIFIQNQYFISSIDRPAPKNRLIEALYLRLKIAIEKKQDFRVLVLIPVLPGGAHIEAASTRYMLKYTYRTISRGGHSLLEKLQRDFPDVDVHEYIRFGTPRQLGRLGNDLVSEPVYIHSKVMIVDDRRAIIGSANINDRSLRGTRDSELCCVIEPGTAADSPSRCSSTMNGKDYEVCKPVHALRIRMYADMVGVKVNSNKPDDLAQLDLLKDPFPALELLMRRAEINTKAYLRVFPGMIPNVVYRISDFKRATAPVGPDADPIVREQRLEDVALIRGIITSWPFDFLKDEPIGIGFFEKEYMVPRIIFL